MKKDNIYKSITAMALLGLWLGCPTQATAQSGDYAPSSKSELAITGAGIMSSLDYSAGNADVTQGQGFSAGLEYTYFFAKSFGISVGAEYQQYGAKLKSSALAGAYNTTDFEQESFEFRYRMTKIEEKQTVGHVNVPVLLTYINSQYGFYIKAGAKIGLPVTGKFSSKFNLATSGYYPQYNGELFDPEFMGFGNFPNVTAKGNALDTKLNYIATVEMGIKQPVGSGTIYAGLYFDYGLTDISDKKNVPVAYTLNNSGAGFNYNSILNSDYAGEVKTLAYGVKLRYSFSL